jgi:DNA-binding GntR family transcriptional regulator
MRPQPVSPSVQPLSRSEQAYRRLTDELLAGRWQPGDTISAYALAQELQISRSPIIEALKRLEAEGLVEIVPQVGCRVVRPSADAVRELYALRGAVEGLAAEEAAGRIEERELRQLRLLLTRLEAATEQGDEPRFEELNHEFHTLITQAGRMPRVTQIAGGIWPQLRFQLALLPSSAEQMSQSLGEHRAIVETLEQRAAAPARAAVERHALQSGARFLAHMASAKAAGSG